MNDTTEFWRGDFGDQYNQRNTGLVESYTAMWAKILARTESVESILELGCGTGQNLKAIQRLHPDIVVTGIEANKGAARIASEQVVGAVMCCDILDGKPSGTADLVFTRGVLIHIPPENLPAVYQRLVDLSGRYVMVCEYYNPTRVEIPYRGNSGKLWKADFAGELMDRYPLRLIDYGFIYHRGPFPQDDVTWFLMEKQ